METAKRMLKRIEYLNSTWRSKFIRELAIWEFIAMNINSYPKDSENQKFWCLVMDLYHKKYKKN